VKYSPILTPCTRGAHRMLKGCSPFRRWCSLWASGVLPWYTPCTRREEPRMRLTPSDPQELTRAVPAATAAPHSNRKQRISPEKSAVVVSGRIGGWLRAPAGPRSRPAGAASDRRCTAPGQRACCPPWPDPPVSRSRSPPPSSLTTARSPAGWGLNTTGPRNSWLPKPSAQARTCAWF